jgi:hypothetical protein
MTTHYTQTETGGTHFVSERRPGEVRIPNYVYDLWMPLLGIEAIGVYAVYCRLEREGTVKAMTQQRLAQEMRIGVAKLTKINDLLQRYGFIKVHKPEGHEKLMHYTTEITICDPPRTICKATIDELKHPQGYEVLCPWLMGQKPNGNAGDTKKSCDGIPNGNANVAPSGIASSDVVEEAPTAVSPLDDSDWPHDELPSTPVNPAQERLVHMRAKFGDHPVTVGSVSEQAQEREGSWTVPQHSGLSPPCAVFKEATGYAPLRTWRDDIDEQVPNNEDALRRWYTVCHAYVGCGWSPRNVLAMLDFYARGAIPSTKPTDAKGSKRGTNRRHHQAEYIDNGDNPLGIEWPDDDESELVASPP